MSEDFNETILFDAAAPGGNKPVVQWQTPHRHEHAHDREHGHEEPEPDFDLVEQAFADTFPDAADPTSFLRLAGIPFTGLDDTGLRLCLLRVELGQTTDVGSVAPGFGGGRLRYDPLPARMASKRNTLRFIYHAEGDVRSLTLAEAKALLPDTMAMDDPSAGG